MAFTISAGPMGNNRSKLVSINIVGQSMTSLGRFQYVYNPALDSRVSQSDMTGIVRTFNQKWESETSCAAKTIIIPTICIPAGFILFAMTAVFIGSSSGFPLNVPIGMALFVIGGMGGCVYSQAARTKAVQTARMRLQEYCNKLNGDYRHVGILFNVENAGFTFNYNRRGRYNQIQPPCIVVRDQNVSAQVAVTTIPTYAAAPVAGIPVAAAPAVSLPVAAAYAAPIAAAAPAAPVTALPPNQNLQQQQQLANIETLFAQGVLDKAAYTDAKQRILQGR